MVKAKKVLCLVLSVIMVFSCFMVFSSAAVGEGKSIGLRLEADKTIANPGDTITYTLYVDLADPSTTLANFILFFSYDNTQLVTPTKATLERTWLNDFAGYYKEASAITVTNLHNSLKAQYTAEETALYNAAFQIQGTVDAEKGTLADGMAITDGTTAQMTFKMIVADSVAPGTKISMGVSPAGFLLKTRGAMLAYSNGTTTPGKYTATDIDFTEAIATVNDAPVVAGPVLTKGRAQYKMETLVPGVSVADNFQYRVLSTISKADWEANFGNTAVEGATTKALTEVGFIAADTATFDLNTAKTAVIANTTGDYTTGLPAGYKAATTNHIYRTDGDATFACRVDTSKDTCADLTYIAFAKYLDADGQPQVIFYDAAATVLLKSSYDDLVNRWLGQ